MKVDEMMDKDFIYFYAEDEVIPVSIKMEKTRRFTAPVVDEEMHLIGWITSFDVTKGLRENKKYVKDILHPVEEVVSLNVHRAAKVAVRDTAEHQLISIPILDDDNKVVGVIRTFDIVKNLSSLYDIKVYKLYKAMEAQLKGVTWDELMEASAIIYRRETGNRIKTEDYELNIKNATFGQAIWATGGLEKFFVGLISVGELVIARKISRAKR